MPKAKVKKRPKVKKEVCMNCSVDVRENTVFCYNCGRPVIETAEDPVNESDDISDKKGVPKLEKKGAAEGEDTESALEDLEKRFRIDEEEDDKLAKAAAERKKARSTTRKVREFVWEPHESNSGVLLIGIAVVVAIMVAATVLVTIF